MKSTLEYLNEAKEALGITSDYGMAKWLNVSAQAVSKYKRGERVIDDYAAVKIAEALKIDPLEVITAANFEREKDDGRKAFWANFSRAGLAASFVLVFLGVSMVYAGFGINFSPRLFFFEESEGYTETRRKRLIFNRLFIMRSWTP
jgi:transcriptional regulator with XRE-family HTH domain